MINKTHHTPCGTIHYWVSDIIRTDDISLIFLPGLTADHRLFDKQLEYFKDKHNVFVWDAPGHAASYPFEMTFTLMDKAQWLDEILEKEGMAFAEILYGQAQSAEQCANKAQSAERCANKAQSAERCANQAQAAMLPNISPRAVHFFDMDQTKPLFRSRDVREQLEQAGVVFHFDEQFMNDPSLSRFIDRLKPNGTLFINSSIVKSPVTRTDIKVVKAPVTELALEMGNPKVINIIMLGVYIGYTQVIPEDVMLEEIKKKLGAKKPALVPLNVEAFNRGLAIGRDAALGSSDPVAAD